jgi:hypothetical protein
VWGEVQGKVAVVSGQGVADGSAAGGGLVHAPYKLIIRVQQAPRRARVRPENEPRPVCDRPTAALRL